MKQTQRIILHYLIFAFTFFCSCLVIGKNSVASLTAETVGITENIEDEYVFVIDAGHGGEDGGAEVNGSLEKELNLAICENLADICTLFDVKVRLTRYDDRLLYDYYNEFEDYLGKKKTYDLRNRLRIGEETSPALFVSIHMNKFTQPQYKGLQVYYSPNTSESKETAEMIRSYAKKYLSPENERETKQATNAIYILKRITVPAVLVECGFMSCPDELALLETREYRLKTACTVFSSCMEYVKR